MKNKILLASLAIGALALSGCATKQNTGTDYTPPLDSEQGQTPSNSNGQGIALGTQTGDSGQGINPSQVATPPASNPTNLTPNQQPVMPEMTIDQSKSYTAVLHTADGDIEISLDAKDTPITANNFVYLAKKNFYNGTIFHRIIKGFMIQGGDPTGTGMGGPGYQFADEKITGQYTRGTVAMANSGANTNGSQFFIMHEDNPLPPNYVIFGHVISGLEVVDKIASAQVQMSPSGEESQPVSPVKVTSVDIIEK